MSEEKICTPLELKQFAFAEDNPTAFNLAKWIESKSSNKFTIIEKEFIRDAISALDHHVNLIQSYNDELKRKWKEIFDNMTP